MATASEPERANEITGDRDRIRARVFSADLAAPEPRESLALPYQTAWVTWQRVTKAGTSEGSASPAALDIAGYHGDDMRGLAGITIGSPVTSPLAAQTTYKLDLGVGADAGRVRRCIIRKRNRPHIHGPFCFF